MERSSFRMQQRITPSGQSSSNGPDPHLESSAHPGAMASGGHRRLDRRKRGEIRLNTARNRCAATRERNPSLLVLVVGSARGSSRTDCSRKCFAGARPSTSSSDVQPDLLRTEPHTPATDRHLDPPLSHEQLNLLQRVGNPVVLPHAMGDDLSREPEPLVRQ